MACLFFLPSPPAPASPPPQLMSRAAAHGLDSPSRLIHALKHDFTCESTLSNIACPVWTSAGEHETLSTQGADRYGSRLGGDLTVHTFSKDRDGALGHCEVGAYAQVYAAMFDWLEEKAPAVG